MPRSLSLSLAHRLLLAARYSRSCRRPPTADRLPTIVLVLGKAPESKSQGGHTWKKRGNEQLAQVAFWQRQAAHSQEADVTKTAFFPERATRTSKDQLQTPISAGEKTEEEMADCAVMLSRNVFARLPPYNPFVGTFHHAPRYVHSLALVSVGSECTA